MNKIGKNITVLVIIVLALLVIALILFYPKSSSGGAYLNSFAQCLSAKGAVMYGAYWCPHCQNEKAAFGSAFSYVNYVECTQETAKCNAAGVQGFPTWIFPDGRRFEGEQGLQKLAEESGCVLPAPSP
jgi:hypothetical protein